MAKKYSEKDLFIGSLFANQVEDAEKLVDALGMLKKSLETIGKTLKTQLQKANTDTTEGMNELNRLTLELEKNTKSLNDVVKNEAKAQQELTKAQKESNKVKKTANELTDEEIKEKIRLQKLNRERRKTLEAEILLENESLKTRNDLIKRTRALRILVDDLDTSTEEGREQLALYNEEINQLNQALSDSDDEFRQQKRNVGNYTDSIKEAIEGNELFANTSGELGLILESVNKLWQLSKKRVEKDTEAKEENEKQSKRTAKAVEKMGDAIKGSIIFLLISGLTAVTAFFTGTQQGAFEAQKALASLESIAKTLLGRLTALGKGIVANFKGLTASLKGFGLEVQNFFLEAERRLTIGETPELDKQIEENTKKIAEFAKVSEQQGKVSGEAYGVAFAEGFLDQLSTNVEDANEILKLQFQEVNLRRELTDEIEKQRIEEERLRAIRDDDTRSFIERQQATAKLRDLINQNNTALNTQLQLESSSLDIQQKRVLQNLKELGIVESEIKRLQTEVESGASLSDLILNSDTVRDSATGLLNINEQVFDELIEQEKVTLQAIAELQDQRLSDRELGRKLLFDEVEQELDFLIDANDQIIQDNQRVIDSERSTFKAREEALQDTIALIKKTRQDIFAEVARTVQGLSGQNIADAFASAEDVSDLNQRLKALGLAEIPINRLLETYREIKTQDRDIKDAQELLSLANVDAEETRQRIQLLNDQNKQIEENRTQLMKLAEVDLSALSADELTEYEKQLQSFNDSVSEQEFNNQQLRLSQEIENLEKRLEAEKEYLKEKEELTTEDSERILEIEEELASKRQELNQNDLDLIKEQNEKELDEARKQAEKLEEIEEQRAEERKKRAEEVIDFLGNLSDEYFDKQIEQIDKELEASKQAEQQLIDNADTRVQLGEESIAFERQRQAELERDRQKKQQQQARAELALASLETLNANDGDVGKTITDIVALREFVKSFPFFYDGTENTGKGGTGIDNKGGFVSVLHPNERVLTSKQNERITQAFGGVQPSNEQLTSFAEMYQSDVMNGGTSLVKHVVDNSADIAGMNQLIDEIKKLPSKMPKESFRYDQVNKALIHTFKEKGRVTNNIFKTNRKF